MAKATEKKRLKMKNAKEESESDRSRSRSGSELSSGRSEIRSESYVSDDDR